jgi:hypothetical protein
MYITEQNIEKISLILLCIATLFSGISAFFQNDFWGKMQQNYVESIHTFGQATTSYSEALSSIQNKSLDNLKDDLLYYHWQEKKKTDPEEAQYLFSRLSDGFQKDIQASQGWTDSATGSYIDEQENQLLSDIQTKVSEYETGVKKAWNTMLVGSNYNSKWDKMTLVSILMSIVLFISGISATTSISFTSRKRLIFIAGSILTLSVIVFIQWLLL